MNNKITIYIFSGLVLVMLMTAFIASRIRTGSDPDTKETDTGPRTVEYRHAGALHAQRNSPDGALREDGITQAEHSLADIPAGAFKQSLINAPQGLREHLLGHLKHLDIPENDYDSLRFHPNGRLFYVCNMEKNSVIYNDSLNREHMPEAVLQIELASVVFTNPVPISSPPVFHSRPGSTNVLFLDFNGHVVTNTAWNSYPDFAEPIWDCRPYSLDADETKFSVAEQQAIQIIWERVAEDYAPFDIDVTTEHPSAWNQYTGHVLITPGTDKNGVECPHFGAGGVAFLDVFGDPQYSYDFSGECLSPAWVLNYEAGGYAEYEAEAASHEMGHNLALSHDGTKNSEYYGGHENGSVSWGPIMGTGYDRNVSQWSKGDYRLSDNAEDDLAIIQARIGYRPDDYGDDAGSATLLPTDVAGLVFNTGILEMNTDRDVFCMNIDSGQVSLAVTPYRDNLSTTWGGNADLILELYDADGLLLSTNNPMLETAAGLETNLNGGVYYLHIVSTGVGDPLDAPSPSGYVQYGSIGQYTITGSVVPNNDWDGDGLPNAWEIAFFGNPTNASPYADIDGDGQVNLSEYISGFDPTNAASLFLIEAEWAGTSNQPMFVITWIPVSGRSYNVGWMNSLTNAAFSNLMENLPYPAGSYTDSVDRAGNAHFYRLETQLMP